MSRIVPLAIMLAALTFGCARQHGPSEPRDAGAEPIEGLVVCDPTNTRTTILSCYGEIPEEGAVLSSHELTDYTTGETVRGCACHFLCESVPCPSLGGGFEYDCVRGEYCRLTCDGQDDCPPSMRCVDSRSDTYPGECAHVDEGG